MIKNKRDSKLIAADGGLIVRRIDRNPVSAGIIVDSKGNRTLEDCDEALDTLDRYGKNGGALKYPGTDWYAVFNSGRSLHIDNRIYVFGDVMLVHYDKGGKGSPDLSEKDIYPVIRRCLDNIVEIWVDDVCLKAHGFDIAKEGIR